MSWIKLFPAPNALAYFRQSTALAGFIANSSEHLEFDSIVGNFEIFFANEFLEFGAI
jgi:hypothetical protein